MNKISFLATFILPLLYVISCTNSEKKDPEVTKLEQNLKAFDTQEAALIVKQKGVGTDYEALIHIDREIAELKSRKARVLQIYKNKTGKAPEHEK